MINMEVCTIGRKWLGGRMYVADAVISFALSIFMTMMMVMMAIAMVVMVLVVSVVVVEWQKKK